MKNPKPTQPTSTLTNKQTSDTEKPPSYWNDSKDEYGFDDEEHFIENDTRHQERDI